VQIAPLLLLLPPPLVVVLLLLLLLLLVLLLLLLLLLLVVVVVVLVGLGQLCQQLSLHLPPHSLLRVCLSAPTPLWGALALSLASAAPPGPAAHPRVAHAELRR